MFYCITENNARRKTVSGVPGPVFSPVYQRQETYVKIKSIMPGSIKRPGLVKRKIYLQIMNFNFYALCQQLNEFIQIRYRYITCKVFTYICQCFSVMNGIILYMGDYSFQAAIFFTVQDRCCERAKFLPDCIYEW